jgi:hypothetical protein
MSGVAHLLDTVPQPSPPVWTFFRSSRNVLWLSLIPQVFKVHQHDTGIASAKKLDTALEYILSLQKFSE